MTQNSMLAAVYHDPKDLRVEQRPMPTIGPNEALLKVINTGICGTDLRIFHGAHHKYADGVVRIPGHEVVGDIAEIGSEVSGLSVGQRVFVAPNMGCGHCWQCVSGNNNRCADFQALGVTLDGAFAEYMRIPTAAVLQGNVISIARETNPAAAAMIEPFACVLRGQNAINVGLGDVVLMVGAGPIGIVQIMLAKLRGASKVIVSELMEPRLEQALEAGADVGVNPAEDNLMAVVMAETDNEGADVIIVAAPAHAAQEEALHLAAIGGRINYFGGLPKQNPNINININANTVHYREILVTGTTACSTGDCRQAAAIVNSGRIALSRVISGRYPLSSAVEAFSRAEERTSLKIVVEP